MVTLTYLKVVLTVINFFEFNILACVESVHHEVIISEYEIETD